MHVIVYQSQNLIPEQDFDTQINDLMKVAQSQNEKFGVTGVLFYFEGQFLQVIEGEQKTLNALMANIKRDSRHKNVETLIDEPIAERGFESWSMAFKDYHNRTNFTLEDLLIIIDGLQKNALLSHPRIAAFHKHLLD